MKIRLIRFVADTLQRFVFRKHHGVIFQNPDDRSVYLDKRLVKPQQAKLTKGSGVNPKHFHPVSEKDRQMLRSQFSLDPDAVVVTMISRFLIDKGIREFLECAARIVASGPDNIIFLVVGYPDKGNLRTLSTSEVAEYADGKRIKLLGKRSDIVKILGVTDLFCLPSYREGLPMSVLEALSCGVPCLAAGTPGTREPIVDGENGLICRPAAAYDIAEKILYFHSLKQDLRKKMPQSARASILASYTDKIVADQHLYIWFIGFQLGKLNLYFIFGKSVN